MKRFAQKFLLPMAYLIGIFGCAGYIQSEQYFLAVVWLCVFTVGTRLVAKIIGGES